MAIDFFENEVLKVRNKFAAVYQAAMSTTGHIRQD